MVEDEEQDPVVRMFRNAKPRVVPLSSRQIADLERSRANDGKRRLTRAELEAKIKTIREGSRR